MNGATIVGRRARGRCRAHPGGVRCSEGLGDASRRLNKDERLSWSGEELAEFRCSTRQRVGQIDVDTVTVAVLEAGLNGVCAVSVRRLYHDVNEDGDCAKLVGSR